MCLRIHFKRFFLANFILLIFQYHNLHAQQFTDVASIKEIEASLNYTDGFGAGVSFYDFNQDGWDDLTFTKQNDSIIFYKNKEGDFIRLPSYLYGSGNVKQVMWVDYNNNGHMDLFMTVHNGPYLLFENDGNFNFTDVSAQAGLAHSISKTYGVSFADFNKNGFLDFYVAKYEWGHDSAYLEKQNQLYRNNGDGTFTNVTVSAGVGDSIQPTFQGVWIDYNNNGWPDLYVINDRSVSGNTLYKNNGDETFTDVTDSAGVAFFGMDPMSTSVADFNQSGFLDIFITNTGAYGKEGMLLKNNGDGTFTESAQSYGVNNDQWAWGSTWIDYNNNTWPDLFVATSRIQYFVQQFHNYFYENINGDTFLLKTSELFSHNQPTRSYGVAKGDFNRNGYYDLIVHNMEPFNAYLWQNSGGTNNWIKITLEGTASNRMAIGSWIKVYAGGNQYVHYTLCGEDYVSQSSQHHIFGLAEHEVVDSVKIIYSRGHIDTYYELEINQHYFFTEGETWNVHLETTQDTIYICEGDTFLLSLVGEKITDVYWNDGKNIIKNPVTQSGKYWATAKNAHHVLAQSDTVVILHRPQPSIEHVISHPACFGKADGEILLHSPSVLFDSTAVIHWNHGDSGKVLTQLTGGVYVYTFFTEECTFSDSILLLEPTPINVQSQVIQGTTTSLGRFNYLINGGTPPYEVYLNDSLIGHSPVDNLNAGTYYFEVFDANACSYTNTFEIDHVVSVRDLKKQQEPVLFPNPVFDETLKIHFPASLQNLNIAVYNTLGVLVFEKMVTVQADEIFDTGFNPLSQGIYTVQLKNQDKSFNFILISI